MLKVLLTAVLLGGLLSCSSPAPHENIPMKIHAFRLQPGQDLRREIQHFVDSNAIRAGWIMTCVGSLTDVHMRYANQPEGTRQTGHFEIVSLVGTLGTAGSHLHLSISDSLGTTTGGHLLDGNIVYTTAEIVIGEAAGLVFGREEDGTTPYKELQVKERNQ